MERRFPILLRIGTSLSPVVLHKTQPVLLLPALGLPTPLPPQPPALLRSAPTGRLWLPEKFKKLHRRVFPPVLLLTTRRRTITAPPQTQPSLGQSLSFLSSPSILSAKIKVALLRTIIASLTTRNRQV